MKPLRYTLSILLLSISAVLPAWGADEERVAAATGEVSALVRTAPLRTMELSATVTAYGRVTSTPDGLKTISLPIAGRVEALQVSAGQHVSQGQLLLKVRPDASGAMAYAQAENALAFARGEVERIRAQLDKQLATRAQLAAARRAEADARQAVAAQQRLGNGRGDQGIVAPFDGMVTTLAVVSGSRFAAASPLMQLAASNRQQVLLGVEPRTSRQLSPGQVVKLSSLSEPDVHGQGVVAQVGSQLDPATRMVNVSVDLHGGDWLTGDTLRADILFHQHQGRAVPRQAVLSDEQGAYLFQVHRGHAVRVAVTPGVTRGRWLEVSGKLADAPVVIEGNYELADGMAIRLARP